MDTSMSMPSTPNMDGMENTENTENMETPASPSQPLNVEKRDGSMEAFDKSKVSNSCVAAGATPELSETIASKVEDWAKGAAVNGSVKSMEIREMVLNNLRMESPELATAFESYMKQQ